MEDLEAGEWLICTPENIKEFSSVAYFFGRKSLSGIKCACRFNPGLLGRNCCRKPGSVPRTIENDPDFKEKLQELNGFDLEKNEEQKIVASRIIRKGNRIKRFGIELTE